MDGGREQLEWVTNGRLDTLSFNEDLETRPWWSPTPDECLVLGNFCFQFRITCMVSLFRRYLD